MSVQNCVPSNKTKEWLQREHGAPCFREDRKRYGCNMVRANWKSAFRLNGAPRLAKSNIDMNDFYSSFDLAASLAIRSALNRSRLLCFAFSSFSYSVKGLSDGRNALSALFGASATRGNRGSCGRPVPVPASRASAKAPPRADRVGRSAQLVDAAPAIALRQGDH